ncbi:DEAD/DEAH box helicase [Desulfomicrobium escambiense]|uniref:DEAD/DEAH box helicase n=1 Tax=Desulfomicrobium escambiense TaxID=29503 RepID=UPI000410F5B8|nr:DEAD/DEAH box helicase [Desulfomicrobium escambiense]
MTEATVADLLALVEQTPWLSVDIAGRRFFPGREPRFGTPGRPWPAPLRRGLDLMGVGELYEHQVRATDLVRSGRHAVVATPTASGKSLIYNLPVLEACHADRSARALYLFPLKALAQDQRRALDALAASLFPTPTSAIYDGDTPSSQRTRIRQNPPNILFTNPDMLHLGILPSHERWAGFFANLRFVVVDEVHTYRGVMGSHMAWVFRRLVRICRLYGAAPTFVCSSATIANPEELAASLTGLPMTAVLEGTAAAPPRHMLLINGVDGAARKAIGLLQESMRLGLRTIVYCKSRRMTELIALWTSQREAGEQERISAYRAGFLPEERREIEARLSSGDLLAVVSTSALELGIDIGGLDVCILVGYPGSIMATLQRSGRVGRGGREAATFLIGHEDALDQYFMHHPDEFFAMTPERAVINPGNPVIAARHLQCAAAEASLHQSDPLALENPALVAGLVRRGELLQSRDGQEYFSAARQPHRGVALRGTGSTLAILDMDSGERIGLVDRFRAVFETHPGAVYLHRGATYVVADLDLQTGMARARRVKVSWYTRVRHEKSTEIIRIDASRPVFGAMVYLGELRVTDQVTGYDRIGVRGGRNLGTVPLDMDPLVFVTRGVWIAIPETVRRQVEAEMAHFMGGIHALEHAAIGMMPLLVMTDRSDLGGISIPFHPQVGSAAVFIYDGLPGGCGLADQAYAAFETLLHRTLQVIRDCGCENGCPSCVHSPKCGSGNRPIAKGAALRVLEGVMAGPAPVGGVGEMPPAAGGHDAPRTPPVGLGDEDSGDVRVQGARLPEGFRFAVLDLETRRSAQEVGGWHRADLMGVSCVVVYDSGTESFRDYLQEDVPRLVGDLVEFDLVVGFNIARFDYAVLRGLSRFDFASLPTLDILGDIHATLGYRLSLDHLSRETLGAAKSASGTQALTWWKEGRIDDIVAYCRQDVAVTRDLFLYGLRHGHLLFRNKAEKTVRVPVDWGRLAGR